MENETKKTAGIGILLAQEVGEGEEKKTLWYRIGRAFPGGKGITLLFDAIPLGGRVVLLDETLQEMEGGPFRVATPIELGEGKTRWVRVGTALANKKGLTVFFTAFPVNGKAVVFLAPIQEAEEEEAEEVEL